MSETAPDGGTPLFTLSTAVFAERGDQILLLKRAGGEMTGYWYLPGGAVDAGETVEEGARRELIEESGLVPSGPLTCVAVAHMRVYGHESLSVMYACTCATGDVLLSDEHSGARWMTATEYRDAYLSDAILKQAEADPRVFTMVRNIRAAFDAYLAWRELRASAGARR